MAGNDGFDSADVGTPVVLDSVEVEHKEVRATLKEEPVFDVEDSLHSESELVTGAFTPPANGVWPEVMLVDGEDDEDDELSAVTDDPLTVNYFCQVSMEGDTAGDVIPDSGPAAKVKIESTLLRGQFADDVHDNTSGSAGSTKRRYKKRAGKDLHGRASRDYNSKRRQRSNQQQKIVAERRNEPNEVKREPCDYGSEEPDGMETLSSEKLYACEFCTYSSTNPCYLKKHMRVHTGSKPFPCSVCHLSFARTCHLKQHMRVHTGEKPYACKICFFRFSQTSSLNRHMSIHTGEKPHSCDICGKFYRQKAQLVRHIRTHVSEEYYTCEVCGYICNHLPSLKNHQRIHSVPS